MASTENILKKIPLFKGLDSAALAAAIQSAKVVEKESGNLFRQGQKAANFYAVLSGKVKVSQVTADGHQVVLRWAEPGNLVGGAPLFGAATYPATATVVSKARLLAWNQRQVDQLFKAHPQVAVNTVRFLGKELSAIRERFSELATENVERRIARALLRLVAQSGEKTKEGVLIGFPLSRQDLAEMTGTTLHTVSRTLSGWERAGMVRPGRKKILIRKPHDLVSLAEDLKTPQ